MCHQKVEFEKKAIQKQANNRNENKNVVVVAVFFAFVNIWKLNWNRIKFMLYKFIHENVDRKIKCVKESETPFGNLFKSECRCISFCKLREQKKSNCETQRKNNCVEVVHTNGF